MPARSLASALKDFGAREMPAPEPIFAMQPLDEPAFEMPLVEDTSFEPALDAEALVAEAVAAAEEALTARLAQEHAEALTLERERHEEELAALQQQIAEEASARMQASIEEAERKIVELTSAVVARILGSLLTDDLRERSLQRLAETIQNALRDSDAMRIRVRGNLPLYEALKTRLTGRLEQLDFTESPSFDLSVTIDDSIYETRLADWSAALAETLA